ncbi:phage major tail tube protein [Lelliottia amnigena]|uniref:phage major tail tube protein n=1 Tax=Lelliottia amnigena TaxID=61646 RepID=UPI00192B272B|nr:phage major tail tube protein [Lelliottia amnigena]MBL5919769.1 phage major tail tube protein [Lelliottia amnigena]
MALFRGCSLFLNEFRLSDSVEYSPPEIGIDRAWYKAGAMTAPVPVDRGTKPMTARYKIAGMDPSAFLFFGLVPGFRARLTVRRAFRFAGRPVFLHDEMEGFIDTIRPDSSSDDKLGVGQEMTLSVNYYRVSVDGVLPLLEINPALGVRKIWGMDAQRISSMLTGVTG